MVAGIVGLPRGPPEEADDVGQPSVGTEGNSIWDTEAPQAQLFPSEGQAQFSLGP